MTDLPLILAVDEDTEALERITGELQRYERDYRVVCGPSTWLQRWPRVGTLPRIGPAPDCDPLTLPVR